MTTVSDFPASANNQNLPEIIATREQVLAALTPQQPRKAPSLDCESDLAPAAPGLEPRTWLGKHVKEGERGAEHRRNLIRDTIYDEAGAPASVARFINLLIDRKGYDTDTAQWFACSDGLLAATTTRTPEARAALRRNITNWRADTLDWLANGDNLRLIDYRRVFDRAAKKDGYEYRLLILDLVDEVATQCGELTDAATIRDRARTATADAYAIQAGRPKPKKTKRKTTAEAEAKRALTTLSRLIGNESVKRGGNKKTADWLAPFLLDYPQLAVVLKDCLAVDFLQTTDNKKVTQGVGKSFPLPVITELDDHAENYERGRASDIDGVSIYQHLDSPPPARKAIEPRHLAFGESLGEFKAKAAASRQRSNDTRAQQAYDNSLSLAEIEAVNQHRPKGAGSGFVQYAVCPDCGGSGKKGKLNVNRTTGAYKCHACGITGKLRENWENPPSESVTPRQAISREEIEAKRAAQLAAEAAEQAAKAAEAAKVYDSLPALQTNEAASKYLYQRTGASSDAPAAGVRVRMRSGQPAIVFPLTNQSGEVVGFSDRIADVCDADFKSRTHGAKKLGVFATAGALEATEIAIVEAPLDALALANVGLPAIALCGTSWPDWLQETLCGKVVRLAFDADTAGDGAAVKLADSLRGWAWVSRLRPDGAKDWAALAEAEIFDLVALIAKSRKESEVVGYEC